MNMNAASQNNQSLLQISSHKHNTKEADRHDGKVGSTVQYDHRLVVSQCFEGTRQKQLLGDILVSPHP
jgi:hypothetical protein